MDKISVKSADLSLRAADNAKSAGRASEVTDDFKKLLTGQGDSQEVSKDTKTDSQKEPAKEAKEEPVKDSKGETVKDGKTEVKESEQTDTTAGLLAAYQMTLNMKPEVVQVTPEMTEEAVPEVQIVSEAVPEVQAEEVQTVSQMPVQEMAAASEVPVKTEVKTETKEMTETPDIEPKAEAVPVQKKSESAENGNTAQSDSRGTENFVQPQVQENHAQPQVQEMKPQEPVRMQVPQPEELPEKVTDQLMAKMSEGVQEFEIHIEPANLGKIAVKILYQEGQATVSIMCSEKKTFEMIGRSAGEIGQVIEKNLGGTTTIVVDKQENDYLNQTRDDNQKNEQNGQEQQKEGKKNQDAEDAEQFLQKLRLGLMS